MASNDAGKRQGAADARTGTGAGRERCRALKKAMHEYRTIINEAISKIHDLNPAIPDFQIPEPESKSTAAGTIYFYPLPDELGLDKQISPNAGLSEHVAVLSISREHSERLLNSTALKAGGPLGDTNRPLAGAAVFNFAETITALGPWVEFAISEGMKNQAAQPGVPSPEEILEQMRTGLEVLKCFRGYSGAT